MRPPNALVILFVALTRVLADPATVAGLPGAVLLTETQVDREGVFFSSLARHPDGGTLPHVRLLPAPAPGTPLVLTRTRVQELLAHPDLGLTVTNWSGADRIRISRRTRPLGEAEVRDLLLAALQSGWVANRGDLDLRLARPWTSVQVPDDPLSLRLLDVPASGLSPLLLVRLELLTGDESVGTWQVLLQLRIWRDVWITRTALRRGHPLEPPALARERRDVLTLREPLATLTGDETGLEFTENLTAGATLYQRHLRLRPVVRRGQTADALLEDGALSLVLRVEVLEDGAPGQIIRLRNPTSRRELKGKVQDENTILLGI
ncbi:MAG: flagellar basal body P-ring formation protein FlgA [Verrucomicrobiales bacterium]|nr:flagellar basal body P-ring formation protein FlgA [Verrucomicrobiales bacterium]